ncbi:hypothetical protein L873DRAFT_366453 [Choiromyces venosus 120613-1]|uniref:Uncharacterized protein n=1 Tax=Choiromyces venosus 120613-1 TaxID=1336337 RepID=A0A3N4K0E2_9PEZI|nr:hypothetical protein L873DRAFT_366453 [Choiromyces venosus 120613-1]
MPYNHSCTLPSRTAKFHGPLPRQRSIWNCEKRGLFQENKKKKKGYSYLLMKLHHNKYSYAVLIPCILHSVGTRLACSSSTFSSLFVPIYCYSIDLPSYPLEHSLPLISCSAVQHALQHRGGIFKISYKSVTFPFLVQKVKFYCDLDLLDIF